MEELKMSKEDALLRARGGISDSARFFSAWSASSPRTRRYFHG